MCGKDVFLPVRLMKDISRLPSGIAERNPVRAGIVTCAEDYPWSSAAAHCGLRSDPVLSPSFPPDDAKSNWQEWLRHEDIILSDMIRKHTTSGEPMKYSSGD